MKNESPKRVGNQIKHCDVRDAKFFALSSSSDNTLLMKGRRVDESFRHKEKKEIARSRNNSVVVIGHVHFNECS